MSISIVDIFKAKKNDADGDYNTVATEYANLDIEWLKKVGNQVISADTSWGSNIADARNLLVLVKGNLTIDAGKTLTAGARKRGMFIWVEGDCTINGAISMTARGASAAGQRLLLENILNNSEVPVAGGAGAAALGPLATAGGYTGNVGTSGVATGASGGGGSGGAGVDGYNCNSGAGTAGTSYSGGSAGGGVADEAATVNASAGTVNGGPGGAGNSNHANCKAGGGAGNNGGAGVNGAAGGNGTGGLLVLFVTGTLTFGASGILSSIGVAGGAATSAAWRAGGGGGSGAGHIDYFYKNISGSATITLTGGAGGAASGGVNAGAGGAGGAGSSRATQLTLPKLFPVSGALPFFM